MENSVKNAISLALATLSDNEKKAGWEVNYSEREGRVYFYNAQTLETQWESPNNGVNFPVPRSHDETGRLATKYQVPKLPNFPVGLRKPGTPQAAKTSKTISVIPEEDDIDVGSQVVDMAPEELMTEKTGTGMKRKHPSCHNTTDVTNSQPPKKKTEGATFDCQDVKAPDVLQEEVFDFPSDVWYSRHLGEAVWKRYKTILQSFVVTLVFIHIERLALPTMSECDGCQHNYPTMYHACRNYNIPLYHETERMSKHLMEAILIVSDKLFQNRNDRRREFGIWKIFLKHTCSDTFLNWVKLCTDDISWVNEVEHILSSFVQDKELFLDQCFEWHEKCNYVSLTFQGVVDYFNPKERDMLWFGSFLEAHYKLQCKEIDDCDS